MSVLGAYIAACVDHRGILAAGERGVLPILAASTQQAQQAFNFTAGIFNTVEHFKGLVTNPTSDTLSLGTGVDIQIRPASFRTIRGISAVGVIADELAFWRSEDSANPDTEILNALRPSLATTGGPLICISSPHAKRGELYSTYRQHFGPAGHRDILVAKGASRTFNPSLKQSVIDRAYERDAAAASAEYGAEFRGDLEIFITREAIDACVSRDVTVRAPSGRHFGFTDVAGGSGKDSFTMAIAHLEGDTVVLDYIGERRPPFSPASVTKEFSDVFKQYGVGTVFGDRYAGDWPKEQFSANGIAYFPAAKNRSELYLDFLPKVSSKTVELLDHPKMIAQFCGLERRTARTGKDSVDHAPNAHEDIANAVAGVTWLASTSIQRVPIVAPFVYTKSNGLFAAIGGAAPPMQSFDNPSWRH